MKQKPTKENPPRRSKYEDHSQRFVDWVNGLGLERTYFGMVMQTLEEKLKIKRVMLVFLFSLGLAFLINLDLDFVFTGYQTGDRAMSDIRSPMSFEMPDEITTLMKKREAIENIAPVFTYDSEAFENAINKLYRGFREMRKRLGSVQWPHDENERLSKIKEFLEYRPEFEKLVEQERLSENLFEWLVQQRFSPRVENALIRAMEIMSEERWTQQFDIVSAQKGHKVALKRPDGAHEILYDSSLVKNLEDSETFLKKHAIVFNDFSPSEREKLMKLVNYFAVDNFRLNEGETRFRQRQAADSVTPSTISIKKGQNIVREGSEIQPSQMVVLNEIDRLKNYQRRDLVSLVMATLFLSMILIFFSFVRRFTATRIRVTTKDLLSMGSVLTVVVLIAKLFLFVAIAFDEKLRGIVPTGSYLYLVPVAAGPMLIGLLISYGEVVWIFTLVLAFVTSLLVDESFTFMVFAVVGGIAAARGVFKCRTRNDIYKAGIRVGLVNVVLIAALTIISAREFEGLSQILLWNVSFAFLGGILSALVTMMLVPFLETVFNYTTDVKLLELSNLNHPLLRDMIVRAPGTYHHSLVVGSMVEAAAEEIQANPLLAKVSSYYHDIGKVEHANYFIENQKVGHNPHDHLSPNMSKTILVAHVKDGVELGEKFKLGKPIIDVIRQHHGTTLISFFYHKAKEAEDSDIDSVNEEEFRYPGPKPQTKEAALSMLADSIEAAGRSLDEPTPVRLQAIVKNIIHAKFMDGQLEECNLTLKDLSVIEEAFVRILLGIYHQRIGYPTPRKSEKSSAVNS